MPKQQKRSVFMMILGVVTALAVIFTQSFLYQGAASIKKETKTEKTSSADEKGKTDQHEAFISIPSNTVLSSVQTDLHHEFVLLFEIVYEKREQVAEHVAIPLAASRYFRTLFRITIAPNAP